MPRNSTIRRQGKGVYRRPVVKTRRKNWVGTKTAAAAGTARSWGMII